MKTKRGQASTLTWIVAAVIIFFVMIVFLAVAGVLAGEGKLALPAFMKNGEKQNAGSTALERLLASYLEQEIDYQGSRAVLADVIAVNTNVINDNAGAFFNGKLDSWKIIALENGKEIVNAGSGNCDISISRALKNYEIKLCTNEESLRRYYGAR